MKFVFGAVSLLVVLVIVLLVAKQQTHAIVSMPGAPAAASGASPGNIADQSRRMQEQVANDVKKALEDGMQRNDRSDRGQVEDGK